MKLISLKSLLTALMGCAFVVIKAVTFDGLADMVWIILFGYLSVKCLVTAFSQEAYDEDVKQARQGKVLYRDLFGKFAYVATDIPIILIFLAGLLAMLCPATNLLRVILIGLILVALGYAIGFSLYVSKHKRLRMENGEWGTGVLNAEDEKAWKQSDLWHSIILGIVAVLGILCFIFGNPKIYLNNARLKNTLSTLGSDSATLEEIVPFEWTAVYTFDPYTSIDRIEWVTGSNSPALKESVSEGMTHVVFTNRGQVVASVCAYPEDIGYYLGFTGGKYTYYDYSDGGYSHIEYGDKVAFEVTRDEDFVRLYAHVEK
ncbi:hypothetical protein [uncultured Oscillibacter sp.]|uniref:hypothetical protein n=1 Tax=uncultured Oscillibacter sp. TaxID=876091 RepID=UPI0025E9369F|nr:hypothetical protein [uncultured Oscillibacter sp.]